MSQKQKQSLTEVIKALDLPEAVDVLAQGIEYLLQHVNQIKRGPVGPKGEAGVSNIPGPKGDTGDRGRDAKIELGRVTSSTTAAATLETVNGVQVLHLSLPKGDTGVCGQPSTVPGPAGKDGQSITGPSGKDGYTPIKGVDYFDGKHGKPAHIILGTVSSGDKADASIDELPDNTFRLNLTLPRGAQGETGLVGAQGPQGELGGAITSEELKKLIEDVVGSSDNEMVKQFIAMKKEVTKIAADARYSRISNLRAEIVDRLKQHYEVEEV